MKPGSIITNICLSVLLFSLSYAGEGEKPRSLALKDLSPERSPFHIPRDNSTEKLWDAFVLVEKANAGDPVAEHELGLRYLLGVDFPADTGKAAYWIGKAAAQNFLPAQYNYGLFLNNGWGVNWNPFDGFLHFEYAAKHGLTEAEYVYGLLFTDNLLVPRNYDNAYRWIRMAADSAFAPAMEVMKEFARRGIKPAGTPGVKDTVADATPKPGTGSQHPALQPIFLDMTTDSIKKPDNATLVKEAIAEGNDQLSKLLDTATYQTADSIAHGLNVQSFSQAAEMGSPEALTVMGRFYEQGLGVPEDRIKATVYYLRAIRLESRWAPMLLWDMIRSGNYFKMLKEHADRGEASAEFAWASLVEGGFDGQLTDAQALGLLEEASKKGYSDAMVQLGLCYSTGRWVKKDLTKAASEFHRAEQLGNLEARIRFIMVQFQNESNPAEGDSVIHQLQKYMDNGSVLAEEVLAYCYETGKFVNPNKPEAVRLYRHAAERGSRVAYTALKELYDEIRPNTPEFQF